MIEGQGIKNSKSKRFMEASMFLSIRIEKLCMKCMPKIFRHKKSVENHND
jgi:hypothetical protein